MERKSFVFLAEGFEEIEALTVVDILRRADINVQTVSITDSKTVKGAHGIEINADAIFTEADFSKVDWLIVPGGMPGASNLHAYAPLNELLKYHNACGGKIAAICAAPAVVLAPIGVVDGKNVTCYPGFEDMIYNSKVVSEAVVQDGSIVTACGPAAAMYFALAIVAITRGEDFAYELSGGLLLNKVKCFSHQGYW